DKKARLAIKDRNNCGRTLNNRSNVMENYRKERKEICLVI
ncbi:9454_t:CDS:1, partial [Funneliformis mosseae]